MAYEPAELDVHSEEAGDQGRRHEHERDEGEYLHDLVLVEVDDTDHGVLEVLETLEAEVGMVDKGRDILEHDVELAMQGVRELLALEDGRDHTLLVDDVLADEHRIVLQLVDVDEEFLADVLSQIDLLVVLGDLLRDELDHIGIEVDTLLNYAQKGDVTGTVCLREGKEPALEVGEALEPGLSQRGQDIVGQDERHGLFCIFVRTRDEEVGVGEDCLLCLEES